MDSLDMIKGIEDLRKLIDAFEDMKADAVKFIAEKKLQNEFLEYHTKKCLEREGRKHEQ